MSERLLQLLQATGGTCDGGGCNRSAVSFAFDEYAGLIPVCRHHICVYRVSNGLWQAEDEYADLRFARRSRWRWLAQRRILSDQRAALAGRESRAQRRRRLRADVEDGRRNDG